MSYHPRRREIIDWLGRLRNLPELTGKTEEELRDHSYPTWGRNYRAWDCQLGTGGTYTMRAIVWYQHIHKPGSTDSRPAIVLKAIAEHLDSMEGVVTEKHYDDAYDEPCGCEDPNCPGFECWYHDDCTLCGGTGMMENDDPVFWGHNDDVDCSACNGTGLARHQTIW